MKYWQLYQRSPEGASDGGRHCSRLLRYSEAYKFKLQHHRSTNRLTPDETASKMQGKSLAAGAPPQVPLVSMMGKGLYPLKPYPVGACGAYILVPLAISRGRPSHLGASVPGTLTDTIYST